MSSCCSRVRGPECHCAQCHQTFSNITLFDLHQTLVGRKRNWKVVQCESPVRMKLIQNERGVWCTPEGAKKSAHAAKRFRQMHREKGVK